MLTKKLSLALILSCMSVAFVVAQDELSVEVDAASLPSMGEITPALALVPEVVDHALLVDANVSSHAQSGEAIAVQPLVDHVIEPVHQAEVAPVAQPDLSLVAEPSEKPELEDDLDEESDFDDFFVGVEEVKPLTWKQSLAMYWGMVRKLDWQTTKLLTHCLVDALWQKIKLTCSCSASVLPQATVSAKAPAARAVQAKKS